MACAVVSIFPRQALASWLSLDRREGLGLNRSVVGIVITVYENREKADKRFLCVQFIHAHNAEALSVGRRQSR